MNIVKKQDFIFIGFLAALFLPVALIPEAYDLYNNINKEHGFLMSFVKFAILATAGEALGLRIREGKYNKPGFGLAARAVVWGFLGLTIKAAFTIFSKGTLPLLESLGMEKTGEIMQAGISKEKILIAFSISTLMNLIYAPVMMTLHKITDTHIVNHAGHLSSLTKRIKFAEIFQSINWSVQWNFVFKKTIPFFWIPAHTITFLLPQEFQVLFAALLGIALGVILSIASLKQKEK